MLAVRVWKRPVRGTRMERMGESWGEVREAWRVKVGLAERMCRRRSAVVARRCWVKVGGPLVLGLWTVSMETWRRLADVGRVETMVGVAGAGVVSVGVLYRLVGTLYCRQ